MKRRAIAFVCSFLVGCGITTPAFPDNEAFIWEPAGSPPPAIAQATDLNALDALIAPLPYADDYDLWHYLSPAETLARGGGDCTAFARLWMAGVEAQGYKARMLEALTIYNGGHAGCLFYVPPLGWRLTSNHLLYPQSFGSDEHQAALAGAAFLYPHWTVARIRDDTGRLLWQTERTAP